LASQALELAEKHQFPAIAVDAKWSLGYARAQLGDLNGGIGIMRQAIAAMRAGSPQTGATGLGYFAAWLAVTQERAGGLADALETIEQALQANQEGLVFAAGAKSSSLYQPEMLRVRGEVRFKHGEAKLAEADFHAATELAHKTSAKACELRAITSLALLLAKQDRRGEARAMLAEIYNWFTEGFDTADLKNAKALLDELSP